MTLLLNTLYVTTPEAHLYKEGETVLVKVDHEKRLQVPLHHLQAIVAMGQVYASPELMRACLERNLSLVFLSERGRFQGRLEGLTAQGAWLRRSQMEAHLDTSRSLAIAKAIVKGKLANQRQVLQRAARETSGDTAVDLSQSADRIQVIQRDVDRMDTHDQVRGCEGEGAARYFEVFPLLIRQQQEAFPWQGPQPPSAQGRAERHAFLQLRPAHGRLPFRMPGRWVGSSVRISPRFPSWASGLGAGPHGGLPSSGGRPSGPGARQYPAGPSGGIPCFRERGGGDG